MCALSPRQGRLFSSWAFRVPLFFVLDLRHWRLEDQKRLLEGSPYTDYTDSGSAIGALSSLFTSRLRGCHFTTPRHYSPGVHFTTYLRKPLRRPFLDQTALWTVGESRGLNYLVSPPATRCVPFRARPNYGTEAILMRVLESDFPGGGHIQSEKGRRVKGSAMRKRHIPATREGREGIVSTRFLILFLGLPFSHCGILYDTATTVNAPKRKTLIISISVAIDALV